MVLPFRRDQPDPKINVFIFRESAFLAGVQRGQDLFQQEHGQATSLNDLAHLEFYQKYLTPFDFDPLGNTSVLVGWMSAFLASGLFPGISGRNIGFLIGYRDGALDWSTMKKEEFLTDVQFAAFLATQIDPENLATMRTKKPEYTELHQIGYAFGMVYTLLSLFNIRGIEPPPS